MIIIDCWCLGFGFVVCMVANLFSAVFQTIVLQLASSNLALCFQLNWMTYSPCGILNEFELTLSVWNEASGIRRLQITPFSNKHLASSSANNCDQGRISGQTTNSFGAFEQRSIWQACSEQRQQSSKHTSKSGRTAALCSRNSFDIPQFVLKQHWTPVEWFQWNVEPEHCN